ncbi:MAG: ABC transporter ATP-binding protein/permease [Bacilli bacterium]|nr:ABC transporter ATP-binding protein/permease [Bacilli bacterium]
MKDLLHLTKLALKGHMFAYAMAYVFQLFAVVALVFSSFLSRVLVDALAQNIVISDPITRATVFILSAGQGAEFIYTHMYVLPIALGVSAVVVAAMTSLRLLVRFYVTAHTNKGLQMLLYDHLISLPYSEYKKRKSGDLLQCCTRDIDVIRRFLGFEMSMLVYTFFIVLLCSIVLGTISWKLLLISICLFPILFIYSFFLIKVVRARYRAADDAEAEVMDRIAGNLNAIRTVKAYGAENKEMAKMNEVIDTYEEKFVAWRKVSSFFFSSSDIFIFFSRSLAVTVALFFVFTGEVTPGTAVIAYTFVNMMVWPLRDSATRIANLGQILAASDRINAFLKIPREDLETGKEATMGDIVFDHVSFAYPDAPDIGILEDVSFKIEKGKTLAIMGKTGSGKSTIAALLLRLYEPDSGKIYLNGDDISALSRKSIRKLMAPVLQDPFLFSMSIEDNISVASDRPELSVDTYAKVAKMDDTIQGFDKGYKTPVGEKGVTLSGGQRQRLALARALASQRQILILDDSLSAVDSQTDLAIRSSLKNTLNGTTFIITHRINSAKDADRIIVLEKGRISEEGTHKELLAKEGFYKELAYIQGANSSLIEKGENHA